MNKSLILASAVVLLLVTFGVAGAASVTVPAADTVTVNGTPYELITDPPNYNGLMWETVEGGGYKACLCKMSAFRALQAVGQSLGISNFDRDQTQIVTGWNTDGPEELYVDSMSWLAGTNFSYADPITGGAYLTLADAWYEFTIDGYGAYRVALAEYNYRFTHDANRAGYVEDWDFFEYRTAFQTGAATADEKTYFSSWIRPQIVNNLKGETLFEVNPVPIPGAVWLFGTGLAGLVGLRRRMVWK